MPRAPLVRCLAPVAFFIASACATTAPAPVALTTSATSASVPVPEASSHLAGGALVAEPVPAPRQDGRLPTIARPERYSLILDVDPTKERFQGRVTIDIDLPSAASNIVLHGRNLHVTDVAATPAGGAALSGSATGRISHGGVTPEELVLTFPSPLPAGRAALSIAYDAPFDRELSGLYRVKDGERWYAFTQFETTAARRALPCFDEPGYKVPFELHVSTPKGMIAVANTPELPRAPGVDEARTRFDFAPTPPLPTYLLAFAVGDFDVRDGARAPVPIRLVTVKGKAKLGDGALEATAALVRELGEYFALPYPFAKLDVVAVPDFAAGAMENPGLVMFREEALLLDPARPSVQADRYEAIVIAHELSHMWFGDLVTMKWWDDVWLNEGFATWMEAKATDAWRPAYAARASALGDELRAMDVDTLTSARAVRQPVASTSEIEETFDGLSYDKAAAVLAMIERWIGPDTMQRGVRAYLRAHAWKNADAADLLGELDRASGRDVSGVAASFLDRPGVPRVKVAPTCANGTLTLRLTQSGWHPLGIRDRDTDSAPWKIPFCVGTPDAREACTVLEGREGSLTIGPRPQTSAETGGSTCPAWTLPSPGYYRASLAEADLRALAKNEAQLDVAGRIGLLSNLWAEVRAGEIAPGLLLDLLSAFDAETDSHVLGAVIATLEGVSDTLIDDQTRAPFRAYVLARLARAKKRLAWTATKGERGDVALSRREVLRAMGRLGRDPATLREAGAVATKWLADPTRVDPDVASIAVPLASLQAAPARLDELRAAARNARAPSERVVAVSAIGAFTDRTMLERAWDLALTDEIRQQDAMAMFGAAGAQPEQARLFFRWLESHWDAARAKTPAGYEQTLVALVASTCAQGDLEAEVAFLGPRAKGLEGASRPLAENAERGAACVALRARGADDVARYFAKGAAR